MKNQSDPDEAVLIMSEKDIYNKVIPKMGLRYKGDGYDILLNNCNHFSETLLFEITGRNYRLP